MASPVFGNFGIRRLMDQNQRFMRGGLPAYVRIKNFDEDPSYSDLGFQYVPPATGALIKTGTTDILIDPPPSISIMSMHTVAMAQMAGARLLAGARQVTISHTWVVNQMSTSWYVNMVNASNGQMRPDDPGNVFRNKVIVGVVTDNLLLEIVDITHEDVFGQPMTWFLFCNASEISKS